MAELPRSSINDSSADYELIQPGADRIESTSGYSTQDTTPPHLRVPPKHLPPTLPRKPGNLPSQQRHYRLAPKARNRLSNSRQRNYRLSQSQRRNYAELQGKRDSEVQYDIPNHNLSDDGQVHRYDAFFAGSMDNQSLENNDTYRQTLVEPKSPKRHCNCSCVVVKNVLCIVMVIVTLLVALAALGLVLHMQLAGSRHTQSTSSSEDLWCSVTVTMHTIASNFVCRLNSTCCTITTEGLPINKSVSPKLVFLLHLIYVKTTNNRYV